MLNKKQYSIFKSLNEIETSMDKKKFKQYVNDYVKAVKAAFDVDDAVIKKLNNAEEEYLIQTGIIENIDQIGTLKDILKSDYKELMKVIHFLSNYHGEIDINIKKFMDVYRKEQLEKYLFDKESPTLVDLFCGAGGMSLGFNQEGYKILLANDIESVCIDTYSFNHWEVPSENIVLGDIKDVSANIEERIKDNVDVVIGGPPCQGFSMANRQRIIDDPRNRLYKYYVEVVHKLKPKFFIMENVKGMLSVAEQVREDFGDLYNIEYRVLNAKDFGVPQNRERLIYIGIREDYRLKVDKSALQIMNEVLEANLKTSKFVLKDALFGLRNLEALTIKNATELDTEESGRKVEINRNHETNDYIETINLNNSNLVFNHKARYNNERDIEIYSRMIPGDKSDSERIADIMPYKSRKDIFKDKYYKLKPNEVCKTITAHMKFDCNMYIHPSQARGLTPREAARVQSYPDDYVFLGSYTKTYMQVGNSVPTLMARQIAKIIKKYI